jgi:hypothetical protein
MAIIDELDDQALSDGGEDTLSPEDQGKSRMIPHSQIANDAWAAKMEEGLEKIKEILGTEEETGLSDQTINQTLWDAWFDVDKALGWLLRTSHNLTRSKIICVI